MRFIKDVQGSKDAAKPLIINYDTVYIHTNIRQIPTGDENVELYEYDEYQYDKNEYITLMAERQQTESELTTEIDLDLSNVKNKQSTESELLTELDFNVFDLIKEIEDLKKRVEVLENNGIN